MSAVKVGWSEVSITPDKPIRLAGQFFARLSGYVETPVSVTAMALEKDGEQAVLVSCDLVNINEKLIGNVRARAAKACPGLNPLKIVIWATHTHTSFLYDGGRIGNSILDSIMPQPDSGDMFGGRDCLTPEDAAEFLADKIAAAVSGAWQNLKPARLAGEFARAVVGFNRRVKYSDGTSKMWGDTDNANFTGFEGGNDSGIELMYAFDGDKLSGVIINVACPSQVVEHRSFISSDYWGKVKAELRKHFGESVYVLGQCSAAGDQCPRDLVRWTQPQAPTGDPNIHRENVKERRGDCSMFDIEGTFVIGKRIAREVIDRYEFAYKEKQEETVFVHLAENILLPLRRVSETEYSAALAEIAEFTKTKTVETDPIKIGAIRNRLYLASGKIDRYEMQKNKDVYPIELHILRLGGIAFATNPFELFLDYGLRIKARSAAKQTFLIQLCSGSGGYLPTKTAEEGGHYSAYITSGNVGHEGGDLLVRITLEKIRGLFS